MRYFTLLTLSFLPFACSQSDGDTGTERPTLEPPKEGFGFQLAMEGVVEPFSEAWLCSVYPLPTTKMESVNWTEFIQNPGTHHLTLSATSLTGNPIPHGNYDCATLYAEMLTEQVMFFGNQGAGDGEMHLPDGIAATFPTGLDILHEIHYVNPTPDPVQLYSYVNAYTIPDAEVEERIWGGQARDEHINIPANSEHTEWTRCVMNEDVEMHFLASHSHEKGTLFEIARYDGETGTTGDVFYSNDDWHDPLITQYEPPLVVPAGSGFEYSCTWKNETDEPIEYGLTAADEMCNLTYVHTPFSMSAQCEVVASSDGVLWTDE